MQVLRLVLLLVAIFGLTGCAIWNEDDHVKPASVGSAAPVIDSDLGNSSSANQVALLLPLRGGVGSAGQAIRDGFVTVYNSSSPQNRPAHINIIDTTTTGNILQAYQQAVDQGANLIVGPLTKSDVQALNNMGNLPVPTLALNYMDSNQSATNRLYQFGLSPLDEARQAAALASQNGYRSALIIAPSSAWGQSVARAFEAQWQVVGGSVAGQLFFTGATQALSTQIRNLLRFNQVNKQSKATRRQDFDVIFLAATPTVARTIRPLLKFYYAGDVPVYATSLVYSGTPQPGLDADLNGVVFCDVPWALNAGPLANVRQKISLFWSGDFQRNARLYALGVDAYRVAMNLDQLSESSQRNLRGATGMLYINNEHRVVRQLTCAQFRDGVPYLLN